MQDINRLVSIIIPVYNVSRRYLEECLNSVLAQTYSCIEVILVDDGALNGLPEVLDELAAYDGRVRVIHQENTGAAGARNAGLSAALGEYVTFVDSDDWISSDTIMEAMDRMLSDELDILLWGSYKCYEDRREEYMPYSADVRLFQGELKEQLMLKTMAGWLSFYKEPATHFGSGSCCSKLYKLSFIRDNQLCYPQGIKRAEDVNFNIRAFDRAERIGYLNRHFYYYRQHEASATYQYRDNGIQVFTDALKQLESFISESNKGELFWQIYYQRCMFFFLESMDMDYLNPNNKKSLFKRLSLMKAAAASEPYAGAVKKINMKYLSLPKRIPVLLIRYRLMGVLCIFYSLYKKLM